MEHRERPHGFCFVGFADPAVAKSVIKEKHIVNGRMRYDSSMGGQIPDPRIFTVCLEELENILKVGKVENLDNSTDVNYYAQLIDEAEGFKKIENLQSLDNNETYGKGVEILRTYTNAATISQETSVAKLQYKSRMMLCSGK